MRILQEVNEEMGDILAGRSDVPRSAFLSNCDCRSRPGRLCDFCGTGANEQNHKDIQSGESYRWGN